MRIKKIIYINKPTKIKNTLQSRFITLDDRQATVKHRKHLPNDVDAINVLNNKGKWIASKVDPNSKKFYEKTKKYASKKIYEEFQSANFACFTKSHKGLAIKKKDLNSLIKKIRTEYAFLNQSKVYSEKRLIEIFEVE